MRVSLLSGPILISTFVIATHAIDDPLEARSPSAVKCKVHDVSAFLEDLSTGKHFCRNLVYPLGIPAKTKIVTTTVRTVDCDTKVKTSVIQDTYTIT